MASWSTRRQLIYFFIFLIVLIGGAVTTTVTFWPRASCQDGRQNQYERGVDCGGPLVGGCLSVCPNEALSVRALWTRVLSLGAGAYDLAAFVNNPNPDLRATHLSYEIKFVDQGNSLINSVQGELSLWPQEVFLIFVPDINVGKRIPVRAYIEFVGVPRWERSSSSSPTLLSAASLTITNDKLTALPAPVLRARLTNNSSKPVSKIDVTVLLSDTEHNVLAANATFVERLGPNETTDISFTWPRPFVLLPTFTEFYPHVAIEPIR